MRTQTCFYETTTHPRDVLKDIQKMESEGWAVRQMSRTQTTEFGSGNTFVVFEKER